MPADVASVFRLNGLSLKSDAKTYLTSILDTFGAERAGVLIQQIVDKALESQGVTSGIIGKQDVQLIVREIADKDADAKYLQVVSAFDIPKFQYVPERKKYLKVSGQKPRILGNADAKREMFLNRYTMLFQRTLRHSLFTQTDPSGATSDGQKTFTLRTVEYLLGSSSALKEMIVLGMLTQLKEGKFFLEDPTGYVELDLSKAAYHAGIFTENSFALVEGTYEDKILHVSAMGLPPAERPSVSMSFFGDGLPPRKVKEVEEPMMVMISDLHLDNPRVMAALNDLFAGFSVSPPTCFVFAGPFLQESSSLQKLHTHLEKFAELLKKHPDIISHSTILLLPSSKDTSLGQVFPSPGISQKTIPDSLNSIPSVHFPTNPCRLLLGKQVIVLVREDVLSKMCRNAIYFPSTGELTQQFAKSLACQGHLSPLPPHVTPVHWEWDHALWLYPLPDLIMVADKFTPFTADYLDCHVVNPGSFAKNDFCFKVYYPRTRTVEDSQIELSAR